MKDGLPFRACDVFDSLTSMPDKSDAVLWA